MSIKRYKGNIKPTKEQSSRADNYAATLHTNMDKPKRYSMECGGDVHCITVMPNREVHFHNHPNINEMVHLVTFDILQNPDIGKSKLNTCLKVLRGLRTGITSLHAPYDLTSPVVYIEGLLVANCAPKVPRVAYKAQNNPKPWREEVLDRYKATIGDHLSENLTYYGMNNKSSYKLVTNFTFCLAPKFTPSAVMSMVKERYGRAHELRFSITVSPKWLTNVWLKNRAIVEGVLILSIEKEYPNGTSLCLAAKQSHGFKIKPKIAVVDFERQVVSWVNDDDRKHELINQNVMPRMRRKKKEIEDLAPEDTPIVLDPQPFTEPATVVLEGVPLTSTPSYTKEQLKVIAYRTEKGQNVYADNLECRCLDPTYKSCPYCNSLYNIEEEEKEEEEEQEK